MQISEIEATYSKINDLLSSRRIVEALGLLFGSLQRFDLTEHLASLENLELTYHNLLKYTVLMGIKDSQRQQIQDTLVRDLFEISDHLRHKIFLQGTYHLKFEGLIEHDLRMKQPGEEIEEHISNLLLQSKLDNIMQDVDKSANQNKPSGYRARQQLIAKLFGMLYASHKLSNEASKMVNKLVQTENISWHEKSVIISAITLGLTKGFDVGKFDILFDTYLMDEYQVSQRAFAGLIIALYQYDNRIPFYSQIENRLKAMQGDENMERDLRMVLMQMTKAKDTDKVSRKFRDEIMPEIIKQAPKIEDKLGLFQILPDDLEGEKNPKWQSLFEDSPDLISRMEEITRMQVEGMDVFINTFANLKHYPFFRQLHHWFLPFFKEHPEISGAIFGEDKSSGEIFVDGLEKTNYICNSDKYSFCFSVQHLPQTQKETLIQMFAAEVEGMNEMASEEKILNTDGQTNSIYTQYIQDLYRFFKLHPLKDDFIDVFSLKCDFHNKNFFGLMAGSESTLRAIGDFYFDRDHFEYALDVYEKLLGFDTGKAELFEKIAYSHERLGAFSKALIYYSQAELYDSNRAWNLQRMAICHQKIGDHEKALNCYQEIDLLEPNNAQTQIRIGNCFLSLKKYDQALNAYYKVELSDAANKKILPPIGWCLFAIGKPQEARPYYEKIISSGANRYDYMNMGHVYYCLGMRNQAIESYLASINQKDNSPELFIASFQEDLPYLGKNGVDLSEIPLLIDYIVINRNKP